MEIYDADDEPVMFVIVCSLIKQYFHKTISGIGLNEFCEQTEGRLTRFCRKNKKKKKKKKKNLSHFYN